MEGADFSFFDRFRGEPPQRDRDELQGIDVSLLLADLRFSSDAEPGLELVDIVVNATRRALIGSLAETGWRGIPGLMIHRKEPYIKFLILAKNADTLRRPAYARIVNDNFSRGGRLMLAPRFLRDASNV
jgi:hypothetical protein